VGPCSPLVEGLTLIPGRSGQTWWFESDPLALADTHFAGLARGLAPSAAPFPIAL